MYRTNGFSNLPGRHMDIVRTAKAKGMSTRAVDSFGRGIGYLDNFKTVWSRTKLHSFVALKQNLVVDKFPMSRDKQLPIPG